MIYHFYAPGQLEYSSIDKMAKYDWSNLTLPADAGQRVGSRCSDAKLSSDPRESAHGLVYLVNHDYCR